jgi:hypothetical protein
MIEVGRNRKVDNNGEQRNPKIKPTKHKRRTKQRI